MKARQLRELTIEELRQKIYGLKQELFDLRASKYTAKLEKPHKISQTKREIARILTILREKESKNAEAKT